MRWDVLRALAAQSPSSRWLIDRFCLGQRITQLLFNFQIHRRYLDGAVSQRMRYWNVKARSIRDLIGRNILDWYARFNAL